MSFEQEATSLEQESMSLEQELECVVKKAKNATTELIERERANQQSKFELVEKNMGDIQDYFDSCSKFDRIVQTAEKNAEYYDKNIKFIQQKLQFQNMANGEEKDKLGIEIKHKNACFRLTKNYCATDETIHNFIYAEKKIYILTPVDDVGTFQYCPTLGYKLQLERAIPTQIQSIFNNLTALYDLRKSDVIDKCISDLYLFVEQRQSFVEPAKEFRDLYYTHYTIPGCILDTTEIIRAIKDETDIIQDNICDIMSFLNDGTLSKYQVDELVYNTM